MLRRTFRLRSKLSSPFTEVCFDADRKSTDPLHPAYGPIDPAAIATVENGTWDFDLSSRSVANANTAVLDWEGDMSSDEITLRFAADATKADSWTIATGLADAAGAYDLRIDGGSAITAYLDTAITGTGTAYDDEWAVTFEDATGTLKFAKITA